MATFDASRSQLEKQIKDRAGAKVGKKRGPTYIMARKDGFLNAAREYHETWGYSPKNVTSLADVVSRIGAASGSLDSVRIVSHGWTNTDEQYMELPVFTPPTEKNPRSQGPTAGHGDTYSPQLLLANPQIYAAKMLVDIIRGFMDTHFSFTKASAAVEAGKKADMMEPGAIKTSEEYEWSTEQTAVAAIAVLELIAACRARKMTGIPEEGLVAMESAFQGLKDRALANSRAQKRPEALEFVQAFATDATTIVSEIGNPDDLLLQIYSNIEGIKAANRASLGDADFIKSLDRARQKLSPGAEIEIRGCNVGRDQKFMNRMQDFFARSDGHAPAVSAPTLYQVFTRLQLRKVGSPEEHEKTTASVRLSGDVNALLSDDIAVNMSDTDRSIDEVLADYHTGELSGLDEQGRKQWRGQNMSVQKIVEANPKLIVNGSPDEPRQLKPFELFRLTDSAPDISAARNAPSKWHLKRTEVPDPKDDEMAFTTELSVEAGGAEATIKEWVRTVLGEQPARYKGKLPVTFLDYSMDNRMSMQEPGLFPGQMQFWRHINYTPPR